MMIKIIVVGKIGKKYLTEAIEHYLKQMPIKVEVIELKDEKDITGMQIEGKKILDKIQPDHYVIPLVIEGKMLDSIEFSKKIDDVFTLYNKTITFVIGGSFGLSDDVKKRGDFHLSLSKMTLPHQLARLFLIEQIYRALMIKNNHPYHK
ncbi:MAG TPA: 23S rRNA (pseudouridine(1915)-N(3))-methyltransferase RlmH [Acholeplasma sp.]|nr:23S rRNA (pseudouridine(1915)-N(3))-methyltransferase RlmH [Acholeplasma sp.]